MDYDHAFTISLAPFGWRPSGCVTRLGDLPSGESCKAWKRGPQYYEMIESDSGHVCSYMNVGKPGHNVTAVCPNLRLLARTESWGLARLLA